MQVGSYGSIIIDTNHYFGHDREYDLNVSVIPKISGKSALQKLGDKPTRITLKIRYHSFFDMTSPRTLMAAWITVAQAGTANNLTLAGAAYGSYVIENIRVAENTASPWIMIDATISFLENS